MTGHLTLRLGRGTRPGDNPERVALSPDEQLLVGRQLVAATVKGGTTDLFTWSELVVLWAQHAVRFSVLTPEQVTLVDEKGVTVPLLVGGSFGGQWSGGFFPQRADIQLAGTFDLRAA
jgi:hypothetical protein